MFSAIKHGSVLLAALFGRSGVLLAAVCALKDALAWAWRGAGNGAYWVMVVLLAKRRHRYRVVDECHSRCLVQCERCGRGWVMRVERRAQAHWDDGSERLFTEAGLVVLSGRMTWAA